MSEQTVIYPQALCLTLLKETFLYLGASLKKAQGFSPPFPEWESYPFFSFFFLLLLLFLLLPSSSSFLLFWRQGFSTEHWLSWNLLCRPGLPQTTGSTFLCLLSARIKGVCHHTWPFSLLRKGFQKRIFDLLRSLSLAVNVSGCSPKVNSSFLGWIFAWLLYFLFCLGLVLFLNQFYWFIFKRWYGNTDSVKTEQFGIDNRDADCDYIYIYIYHIYDIHTHIYMGHSPINLFFQA